MDEIARLLAVEDISILKAKYYLGVDTQDWNLIRREVFTESISFQFSEFREEPFVGRDVVLDMFAGALKGKTSVHHGHMPIIEVESDAAAKGLWAMEDRIYLDSAGPLREAKPILHGFGHYHETYVNDESGWRIDTIRLTRLRLETRTIL